MWNQIKILGLFFLSITFYLSCSSSVETQVKKEKVDSLYIFDEVPPEDIYKFESPVDQTIDVFVIQIGAFSNLERAKEFADKSWIKLKKEIKVEYRPEKNLFVVLIYPPFQDKESAIKYRYEIQKNGEFSDAWIVEIESNK